MVSCEHFKKATEVLLQVLSRFDFNRRVPEVNDLGDFWELAYQLFNGKKVLIVLDNIQPEFPIEQVVNSLHATGATLLLTSRQVLPSTSVPLDATRTLGLLSSEEALDLFVHSFGKSNISDFNGNERSAIHRIVNALDRHTLAVNLAAANATNLSFDLEVVADKLEATRGYLSYQNLKCPKPWKIFSVKVSKP